MSRIGRPSTKIGDVYERWTIVGAAEADAKNKRHWMCQCSCGVTKRISEKSLRDGCSRSCGCLRIDVARELKSSHGLSRSKTYRVWASMRKRCSCKNAVGFKHYGGRGISVCDEWESFAAFVSDMGEVPAGLSLDRIDNAGNYCVANCRWATRVQQARNTTRNIYLTFRGATKSLAEWAEIYEMGYDTLRYRIRKWGTHDMDRVLETPVTSQSSSEPAPSRR